MQHTQASLASYLSVVVDGCCAIPRTTLQVPSRSSQLPRSHFPLFWQGGQWGASKHGGWRLKPSQILLVAMTRRKATPQEEYPCSKTMLALVDVAGLCVTPQSYTILVHLNCLTMRLIYLALTALHFKILAQNLSKGSPKYAPHLSMTSVEIQTVFYSLSSIFIQIDACQLSLKALVISHPTKYRDYLM